MTQSTPLATTSFPGQLGAARDASQPDGAGLPITGRVHHASPSAPRTHTAPGPAPTARGRVGRPTLAMTWPLAGSRRVARPRGPALAAHRPDPAGAGGVALTGPGFGAVSRAVPASIRSSPALLVTAQTAPAGRQVVHRRAGVDLGHDQRPPGCRVDPHDQPADGQPDRLPGDRDGVDRGAGGNDPPDVGGPAGRSMARIGLVVDGEVGAGRVEDAASVGPSSRGCSHCPAASRPARATTATRTADTERWGRAKAVHLRADLPPGTDWTPDPGDQFIPAQPGSARAHWRAAVQPARDGPGGWTAAGTSPWVGDARPGTSLGAWSLWCAHRVEGSPRAWRVPGARDPPAPDPDPPCHPAARAEGPGPPDAAAYRAGVRDHAALAGVDGGAGRRLDLQVVGDLGDLAEQVDELLGDPDEVAGGDVLGGQHVLEGVALAQR